MALNANTGRQVWKTYTITEPLKPLRKNSNGTQLWGPSGGGVWSSPTIDPVRHAVYIGTGDAYTEPAPATTDAIMALDMDTGKVLWAVQDTPNDAWNFGCWTPNNFESCPKPLGFDYDFGASPILATLPSGKRLLIAGQKSGIVWAHDPDHQGALVWKADLATKPPGSNGEIVWGGAADGQSAYFGLNSGGLAALHLSDGQRKWFTPLQPAVGAEQLRGQSGPLTAIPGVVFSDGVDGIVRALSTADGQILWQYNTLKEFDTVNGIKAKGGSMEAAGPIVAGGMLFVPSGYIGMRNAIPGNVSASLCPAIARMLDSSKSENGNTIFSRRTQFRAGFICCPLRTSVDENAAGISAKCVFISMEAHKPKCSFKVRQPQHDSFVDAGYSIFGLSQFGCWYYRDTLICSATIVAEYVGDGHAHSGTRRANGDLCESMKKCPCQR